MHTTPSAEVGANIRAEMARRGVSQVALCARLDHLGLSQSQLSKRLSGAVPLDVNEVAAIAEALAVDLSILLPTVGAA